MPLYQNQTNLAGQGKFSPSVNYYAGIRAPVPSAPSLPKHEASFNIDLSRIGDAMIAAKESETKLGLAAVEMEQNLRNAERDRQLKIDLLDKQIAADDARKDKELAMNWQIASMKNDTELLKLQKEKEAKEKDMSQQLANNAFIQRMRDAAIARQNNMGAGQFSTIYNKTLDEVIEAYPNADISKIGEAFNKLYPGMYQFSTTSMLEKEKEIEQTGMDVVKEEIKNSPTLSTTASYNPRAAYQEVAKRNQSWNALMAFENLKRTPGITEEEKQAAWGVASEAGITIAQASMVEYLSRSLDKMRQMKNNIDIFYFEQEVLNNARNVLSQATGNNTESSEFVDRAWLRLGGKEFMDKTLELSKNNKELSDNLYSTKINNVKLNTASINGLGFFMSLPGVTQSKILEQDIIEGGPITEALGSFAFGNVVQDEEGNYKYMQNLKVVAEYSKEEANRYMKITGASTPEGAIRRMQMQQGAASIINYRNNMITAEGAVNNAELGAMAAKGTEYGDQKAISDYQNPADSERILNNLTKYANDNPVMVKGVRELCDKNGYKAPTCRTAYTSGVLSNEMGEVEKSRFDQAVRYCKPTNIGEGLKEGFIKTVADRIKNSEVVIVEYPGDDSNIGIDYIDKGFAGPAGLPERWIKAGEVLSVLNSNPKLEKEDKIAYLKQQWGINTKVKMAGDYSLVGKAYRNYKEFFYKGINALAKLESEAINKYSYKGEDVVTLDDVFEGSLYQKRGTKEKEIENFNNVIAKERVENPTDNPYNQDNYPLVDNGNESASGVKNIIKGFDDTYYIIPTMWDGEEHSEEEAVERFKDTRKHFGGYKSVKAAENAEEEMHKYHDLYAERFLSEKRHKEWLETQPDWKQLIESFGLAKFKED